MFTSRIQRLALPERAPLLGGSLISAEHELARRAVADPLAVDLTHADTKYFPPPARALEEFAAAVHRGAAAFTPPPGDRAALEAVAPNVSEFLGIDVDPHRELALTPGTQAALFCVMAALIGPGDLVALVDPDYLSSERMVRFFGGCVHPVPLDVSGGKPELDLNALEVALRRGARLVLFSHPNNPTGAVYDKSTITAIAELCTKWDAFVVADELYSRFLYDDSPFPHLVREEGMRERSATLLGPSKTESMSGYRIGCFVGPTNVATAVTDVLDITAIRAPSYAQHSLRGWLTEDGEWLSDRISTFKRLRDSTVARLREVDGLRVHVPQATGYVFPDASSLGRSSVELAQALLADAGVIVNPGIAFGERGANSFRICFAQDERTWPGILDRVAGTLAGLAAKV